MIIDDDCIICIRIILLERKTPKQLLDLAQPCHIAAPAGLLRSADGPMSHQGMRWRWNLTCQRDAKRGNLGYSRAQARIQGSFSWQGLSNQPVSMPVVFQRFRNGCTCCI